MSTTAINSCPICGLAMYSFERTIEIYGPHAGTAGDTLTLEHFAALKKHIEHQSHLHLVREIMPGIYKTV